MTQDELLARASALCGFHLAIGAPVVTTTTYVGQDHEGREHTLPIGYRGTIAGVLWIGGDQGVQVVVSVPVYPEVADPNDEEFASIEACFDEADPLENAWAFHDGRYAEDLPDLLFVEDATSELICGSPRPRPRPVASSTSSRWGPPGIASASGSPVARGGRFASHSSRARSGTSTPTSLREGASRGVYPGTRTRHS